MLGLLGALPAHAQIPDSAKTLRAARSAQARFETIRRNNLSWTWSRGSGSCDERIGRFCLTHGDDDEDWRPPPEPEKVQQARMDLLTRLDSAAARLPGDEWIAGQRVRYSVEAGRLSEAVRAAEQCRAADWWCFALAGYARHTAGDFAGADSAFNAALNTMPSSERRQWTDISVLVEGGGWRAYDRAQGVERDSLEQRFWWLADPLWMVPGNELRSEHLARHVIDRLQDRSRSTEGLSWGADLREITLRYGWPVGWERERPVSPTQTSPSIISHYAPRSRHFAPTPRIVADPTGVGSGEWSVDVERPRTAYLPSSLARFDDLEHQLATFRRGDSVLLVAAYALNPDSVGPGPVDAGLVVARSERTAPVVARDSVGGIAGALSVLVPPKPAVLSLEVKTHGDSARALRARYGIRPTPSRSGVSISDLLLLFAQDKLPRTLEDAMRVARGSTRVQAGERVGLFWEVYGLPPGTETTDVAVSLTRDGRNWLRRPATPVRLSWEDRPGADPIWGRALAIALPDLPPGRYTLQVTVAPERGQAATASRTVEVMRPIGRGTSPAQAP
jgi:hypothetical protein